MRWVCTLWLLFLCAGCASPISSMQSKYVSSDVGVNTNTFTLHLCRPKSTEYFYKSVGLTINGDPVTEIGSGENFDITLEAESKYRLGFYPPDTNVLIRMMGRDKAFGVLLDGKAKEAFVILSTDNLMLSIQQEKENVIKNYYEVSIYPWQVRAVKQPLFEQLCGAIKKNYLSKKTST